MKRIAIFGVHLSYWIIYLFTIAVLFIVITAALENNTDANLSVNGVLTWKNIYVYNNFIAAPLGFYLFYFVLFSKINQRIKWYKILLYGIAIVLFSGLITTTMFILTSPK